MHGLINYKDTKNKMSSFKKVTCKGTLPPPPSLCQSTVYTGSVWLGGDGVVELCWRPYSCWSFKTLYLTRFRTYKIAKTQEGRGPQKDKHLPHSPLQFFQMTTFCHFAMLSISLIFLRICIWRMYSYYPQNKFICVLSIGRGAQISLF